MNLNREILALILIPIITVAMALLIATVISSCGGGSSKPGVPADRFDFQGSPEFINHWHVSALHLQSCDPEAHAMALKFIDHIWEKENAVSCSIQLMGERRSTVWCNRQYDVPMSASIIAHESYHGFQYHSGGIPRGMTEEERRQIESDAIDYQMKVGDKCGVTSDQLAYLDSTRGHHSSGL